MMNIKLPSFPVAHSLRSLGNVAELNRKIFISAAATSVLCFSMYRLLKRNCHIRRVESERKKCVFVIGADSGFGFSTCWYLHQAGCMVVAGCLESEGSGARQLREAGMLVVEVDVRQPAMIQQAFEEANQYLQSEENSSSGTRLSAVIYNSAVLVLGRIQWLTVEQISQMITVNLTGALLAARASVPLLERSAEDERAGRRAGRFILVSSLCGQLPCQELAVYSATKAAIFAMAQAMRLDLACRAIDVSVLVPGDMATSTKILALQNHHLDMMWNNMTSERRLVEREQFASFRQRFAGFPEPPDEPVVLQTPRLRRAVLRSVFDQVPRRVYTAVETGSLLALCLAKILPSSVTEYLLYRHFHYKLHALDADWLDLNGLL